MQQCAMAQSMVFLFTNQDVTLLFHKRLKKVKIDMKKKKNINDEIKIVSLFSSILYDTNKSVVLALVCYLKTTI